MRALVLVALMGCVEAGPPIPEAPVWGKVPCGHCSMLVTEAHPAAQAVLSDGARRHFDDIGCLVTFLERERQPPKAAWVNDGRGGWVPVERARFLGGQVTPMASGYLASESGTVSFQELRERLARGEPKVQP